MHMEGMRPRRQPLEIGPKHQGYLFACADGNPSVSRMNEPNFPTDPIQACHVKSNEKLLWLLVFEKDRVRLVLRYRRSSRHTRQPDRCTRSQQAAVLTQRILVGVVDDLPFCRIIIDLPRNAFECVVFLQQVFNVTCRGGMRMGESKHNWQSEQRASNHVDTPLDRQRQHTSKCQWSNKMPSWSMVPHVAQRAR